MTKIIVCGTSRSGKSTLIKNHIERLESTCFPTPIVVDVLEYVLAILKDRELPIGSLLSPADLLLAYRRLIHDLTFGRKWDILEIAPDFLEQVIPWIAQVVTDHGDDAEMIWLCVSKEECLHRNKATDRKVPVEVIEEQSKYTLGFVENLCNLYGIRLRFSGASSFLTKKLDKEGGEKCLK